jgi:hypothetical protein
MMLHVKNEYQKLDAPFAEKGKDIETNDLVVILTESVKQPSRFDPAKDQTLIKVKTKNGERYVALNQKSINILIDEFRSNNDKDWVGKTAKVLLQRTTIGGKKVIVAYLVGINWELDEYGEPTLPGNQPPPEDDIPVVQVDEDEDILSKVPF